MIINDTKISVGDKLKVRKDLNLGDYYGYKMSYQFTRKMNELKGKVVTVSKVDEDIVEIEEKDNTQPNKCGWPVELFEEIIVKQ